MQKIQNWEIEFDKKYGTGNPMGMRDFISQLLTSKSELMEGEKRNEEEYTIVSGVAIQDNKFFNAGISKAIEILKK